ncbi:uncharacterized protein [Amphiura filiformis]|uniref:uncharacterized protein n=1 Tax=Amphiura filiformis TaxID=82378 RepID=UPI003B20D82B
MSLLSTVYSQSWPAPDPVRGPRKGFFGKRPRETASSRSDRPQSAAPFLQIQGQTINPSQQRTNHFRSKSAFGFRSSHPGGGDGATSAANINGQLGLDKSTLHWKSWSSYKSDCEQAETDADLSLYRLTTDTFRRLSQQLKDVDQQFSGRYHNSGFKSYYVVDDKTVVPALRRSQLAASLPSHPPSICSPTPHEAVSFEPSEDLQCTTFRSVQRKKRPQSSFVRSFRPKIKRPPRPKSSAAILGRDDSSSCSSSSTKDEDARKNDFDHITPEVIEKLAKGEDKDFRESQPGPFDIVNEAEKPKAAESEDEHSCDDGEVGDDEDYTDDEGNLVKRKSHRNETVDHDDDVFVDESGYRIREPPDFDLSPEDLDVDDSSGQFSYNSSNMRRRKQDMIHEPLSHPFCHMDLLGLSEFKNWKKELKKVPEGLEEDLMDRMIELAKLQANTAHWERCQGKGSSRPPSSLQVKKGWNADAAIPTERMHSALSKPKQSKNCLEDCTQLACAGDCKNKNGKKCPYCKQTFCNGACVEYDYHLFIRTPRDDDDVMPTRPKSCKGCCSSTSSKYNHVKSTLNANSVVLGRPKSAFATFSSAKHQVGKPKALTVSQTAGAEQVSSDLARLGLKAPSEKQENGVKLKERPHTAKARVRLKGRDAILPGKSFQSQRRNSLTDDLISTTACSMNTRAMRARSARMRAQRCKSAKK